MSFVYSRYCTSGILAVVIFCIHFISHYISSSVKSNTHTENSKPFRDDKFYTNTEYSHMSEHVWTRTELRKFQHHKVGETKVSKTNFHPINEVQNLRSKYTGKSRYCPMKKKHCTFPCLFQISHNVSSAKYEMSAEMRERFRKEHTYSLFTRRKPRSPLRISGGNGFGRGNGL